LPHRTAQAGDITGTVFSKVEKCVIREAMDRLGLPAPRSTDGGGDKDDDDDKGKKNGLPLGLAKRDRLPPSMQKHMKKHGQLPPGLHKRALPPDVESQLPARKNAERAIVGNDVVLIQQGTNLILDIIKDVVRKKKK